MAQPTAYTRVYDFSDYQTDNPSSPLPGDQVDAEFDALKLTTDEVRANLALIQRDDGALKNAIVTPESLSTATTALLTVGGSPQGAWLTATAYEIGDVVTEDGATYICNTDHTSGTFATDLAATKWLLVSISDLDGSDLTNGSVTAAKLDGTDFTAFSKTLFARATAALWRTDLGLNGLEVATTFGKSLVDDADAATARTTLGAGAAGAAVFVAASERVAFDAVHANGADIASDTTIDLDTATGDEVVVTGTTTITGVTLAAGKERKVRFAGALLLTHGASLVLPGAANVTTAAGDTAVFRGYAGGVVRMVGYMTAKGGPARLDVLEFPVGTIIDRAYAEYTTNADLATTIPLDDTAPGSGEGTQILSVSITPKSTTNRIRVHVSLFGGSTAAPVNLITGLFNGGSTAVATANQTTGNAADMGSVTLDYEYVPGALTPITFTVRVGDNSGTIRLNGVTGGRLFGGTARAVIIVEEIVAA